MNRTYLLAALLMFGGGIIGAWITRSSPIPAQAAPAQKQPTDTQTPDAAEAPAFVPLPNSDDEAQRQITDANHGEALQWLTEADVNRGVAQWGKEEAIGLVRHFYAAGAVKIYVVDVTTAGDAEVASQFIVELPSDPAARAALFKLDASFESEYSAPPAVDSGQKYLSLVTD